ncbi:metallophosphoesterase [Psychrobacillus sp. FSL H8-0484]|uniref:metallophosphoesterase family protein n=1 Tax=Psychrobacillus sp. FSL H8-0484 TaxID=2921390 RepID=UPI0030F9549F
MMYALLGDIHSSVKDLTSVLQHIYEVNPSVEIICTGDLFECTIGKKRAMKEVFSHIEDVISDPSDLLPLINFQSVYGNQEERIISICLEKHPAIHYMKTLPRQISIAGAVVTHGHEWEWSGEPWTPVLPITKHETIFFGHSHQSALFLNGERKPFRFDEQVHIPLATHIGVNVGSVIDNREWVLYDPKAQTIEFKKTAM